MSLPIRGDTLAASRCAKCGAHFFPPRHRCPSCMADTVEVELPREGTVLTFSEVHVSNGRFRPPYVVAIVELGPVRVPGIVINATYDDMEIGDRVAVIVERNRYLDEPDVWYYFVKK